MKVKIAILVLALLLSISTIAAVTLTDSQIQALTSLITSFGADQSVINNVKASLTGSAPVGTPSTGSYNFTRSLTVGSTGADVMDLQKFLNDLLVFLIKMRVLSHRELSSCPP